MSSDVKKNIWKIAILVVVSVTVNYTGFAISKNYTEKKDFTKHLEGLATIKYVDDKAKSHEEKEALMISYMQKNIERLEKAQIKLSEQYLKQIIMLRTDLNLKENKD